MICSLVFDKLFHSLLTKRARSNCRRSSDVRPAITIASVSLGSAAFHSRYAAKIDGRPPLINPRILVIAARAGSAESRSSNVSLAIASADLAHHSAAWVFAVSLPFLMR